VCLDHEQVLFQPNEPIEHGYFLNTGMVSMVVITSDGVSVEVGVVGREGFVGIPIVFDLSTRPATGDHSSWPGRGGTHQGRNFAQLAGVDSGT